MSKDIKTNVKNQILNQLVFENCLRFGRDPKLNNRKINHYLFGTREKLDIFKLYELRYLLLKVYPLIHNLFLQARLNVKKKKKFFFNKNFNFKNFAPHLPEPLREWEDFQAAKKKFNQSFTKVSKPILPKILFATTNEMYSEIVSSAARMCYMPFHVNRWIPGAITAGSSAQKDKEKWFFFKAHFNEQMQNWFQKKVFKDKKNIEQQEHQKKKYQFSRKPSLIIIPDVSKNEIIIRETNVLGIPVLGLVNSDCQNSIAYPIFANDQSVYSIHFFCHFLGSLITKEIVKTKHKFKNVSKNTVGMQFPQALKNMSKFYTEIAKADLENMDSSQNNEWVFKGKYFLEHYVKPRARIRKKARRWWNVLPRIKKKRDFWAKNMKTNNTLNNLRNIALNKTISKLKTNSVLRKEKVRTLRLSLKNVSLKSLLLKSHPKVRVPNKSKFLPHFLNKTTRKTIFLENQKRLKKNGMQLVLRKQMLGKMNLILQLHKLPFTKIKREIRLPTNLPKFRFWKVASTFYHRKPIKLATNTALGYRFKRFSLKKLVRTNFQQNNRSEQKRWRNINFKNKRKNRYLPTGYRGFRHTEDFKRYSIKIGLSIDYEKLFEKKINNKKLTKKSMLYRKRWHSKKEKKK